MHPISRLNEMMCCYEGDGKASTTDYVLNIFQYLQWLQPQILQPRQSLVSMPGQCVVLFAPLNLPATLLRFSFRSHCWRSLIESKSAPIVRKRNFLSSYLSGLREWGSLIQVVGETHLITSDLRDQLHQLNLSSIASQCLKFDLYHIVRVPVSNFRCTTCRLCCNS